MKKVIHILVFTLLVLSGCAFEEDESISLADAIELLEEPEFAIAGQNITNTVYWVWVQKENSDDILNESWVVDVGTGEANKIGEYQFYVPFGPNVSHRNESDEYFHSLWSGEWEGITKTVEEYIDKETYELAFMLELQSERVATIKKGETELRIQYSPANACEELSEDMLVTIDGLDINGSLVSFESPLSLNCAYSDFHGRASIEPFRYFVFSEADSVVRLGLSGDLKMEIPVDDLQIESVLIK